VEGEPVWAFPFKRKMGDPPAEQALHNRLLTGLRAVVERFFLIVKRHFGYTKVRYRGLFKNGQQLYLLVCSRQSLPRARDIEGGLGINPPCCPGKWNEKPRRRRPWDEKTVGRTEDFG
jgi:hypothetical protein